MDRLTPFAQHRFLACLGLALTCLHLASLCASSFLSYTSSPHTPPSPKHDNHLHLQISRPRQDGHRRLSKTSPQLHIHASIRPARPPHLRRPAAKRRLPLWRRWRLHGWLRLRLRRWRRGLRWRRIPGIQHFNLLLPLLRRQLLRLELLPKPFHLWWAWRLLQLRTLWLHVPTC